MQVLIAPCIVRSIRAWKRYERQGILVSDVALEQADAGCFADSELRAWRRERDAKRCVQYDRGLVAQMTREISRLFPGRPPKGAQTIAEHTARRGSGRVGRASAGERLEEEATSF